MTDILIVDDEADIRDLVGDILRDEGHRTRDGRLGPFYPGAFRLAIQAGVPVVPMALRGLRNVCPREDWRIRPGHVDVLFGAPIPTAGLGPDDIDPLGRRTRRALNDLLLRGGKPGP